MAQLVRTSGLFIETYDFTGTTQIEITLCSNRDHAFDFTDHQEDLKRIARRMTGEIIDGKMEFVITSTQPLDSVLFDLMP